MFEEVLTRAVGYRRAFSYFDHTETLRVFYGPGESDHTIFRNIAIDQFKDQYWVTTWKSVSPEVLDSVSKAIQKIFPLTKGIVWMDRSEVASDAKSTVIFGNCDSEKFSVLEFSVPYLVQMEGTKHPGLFLDHADLRKWLLQTQMEKNVLNLFSYTGSLSVAAGLAGLKKSPRWICRGRPLIGRKKIGK